MAITWKKLAYDADLTTHTDNTTTAHGAVSTATASKIVVRDAAKRAAFAAPSAAGDVAILSTVTDHTALTTAGTHGSTAAATASKIVIRDASARAAFAAPAAAGDTLIKGTALTITEMAALTTGKIWQGVANRPSEVAMPAGATVVLKTSTETVSNSTVLQNDDQLLFAVGNSDVWEFFMLLCITTAVTPDFKFVFTLPAGGSLTGYYGGTLGALAAAGSVITPIDLASGFQTVAGAITNAWHLTWGRYVGGGTAGNVQLQWAQNTAEVSNTQVLLNSYILAHKLG